ncbi:hypothetical protein POKO110462_16860 [Pontibacter korlensis]|uniref:Uncharacterized protein n=1 Tax=Pontibacter korlensis TaxID=400092 RepID=A0A0E3UWE7_9BACT|nr:hypothetical protein [Pontibacter korlensis]AKD03342.1 hypothetical protein PKOR_09685 [Pontibacter korlensis]
MQQIIQQAFDRLIGQPLTKTTRTETIQYFHFGHTHYTTPQGLVLDVGEMTLAVDCPWQLQHAEGYIIKHSEVYIRKREEGLPNPVWNWKEPGSNMLDQRMMALVNDNPNLIVERVEQQDSWGLMLYFSDGTFLSVMPDPMSAASEYWQLFSNTGDGLRIGAGEQGII